MWSETPSFDLALICLNGHVINTHARGHEEFNLAHCQECGAKSINQCTFCHRDIPGSVTNVYGGFDVPSYCGHCGKPYPWTEKKVQAAKAMADELEELNGAEREELKQSIDLIAADTPMTEVGVTKFKKMLKKMLPESAGAMRRFAIDVAGKVGAELLKGQM